MNYQNPIIPGFHPDPSICKVGSDYYLVNSSFDYFPGVPLFHSKDLVNWHQIGYCLTRENQLPLGGAWCSGGIYAPTIRHNKGRFYMITTNVSKFGHFYVFTDDINGEWSDPILIDGPGIDPDLFFDTDGKVYFTRTEHDKQGIKISEIDIATGKLIGEKKVIWRGFEDLLCEGPHLYKIGKWYYLMVAEGGTHRGHMEVIGRSDNPYGPFESYSKNPILSHRARVDEPIQATGHADLIQADDNSWWLVFLGIRQMGWGFHHLGRETFLAPVTWTTDGWPVVNSGQPITLEMNGPVLEEHKWPTAPTRDEFTDTNLGLEWNTRKNIKPENWSLSRKSGYLSLKCDAVRLDEWDSPVFIGRRQEHFSCTIMTKISFTPENLTDEAGITLFMKDHHHYDLSIIKKDKGRSVFLRKTIGDIKVITDESSIDWDGAIILKIDATSDKYAFSFGQDENTCKVLGSAEPRYISQEVASGFTGVYAGMYATGNGKTSDTFADFDWFDYIPLQEIRK